MLKDALQCCSRPSDRRLRNDILMLQEVVNAVSAMDSIEDDDEEEDTSKGRRGRAQKSEPQANKPSESIRQVYCSLASSSFSRESD